MWKQMISIGSLADNAILSSLSRRSAIHPQSAMSGADARSQNLPGSFDGFLAES
jgi:hypothetical protein